MLAKGQHYTTVQRTAQSSSCHSVLFCEGSKPAGCISQSPISWHPSGFGQSEPLVGDSRAGVKGCFTLVFMLRQQGQLLEGLRSHWTDCCDFCYLLEGCTPWVSGIFPFPFDTLAQGWWWFPVVTNLWAVSLPLFDFSAHPSLIK